MRMAQQEPEAESKRPTERTPKSGIEVPIPKRAEFMGNLKKIAGGKPEPVPKPPDK